jgi:hypothetical protein
LAVPVFLKKCSTGVDILPGDVVKIYSREKPVMDRRRVIVLVLIYGGQE